MDMNRIIGKLIESAGIYLIGGGIAIYVAYTVATYVSGVFHQVSNSLSVLG